MRKPVREYPRLDRPAIAEARKRIAAKMFLWKLGWERHMTNEMCTEFLVRLCQREKERL